MDIYKAHRVISEAIDAHGLYEQGWSYKFGRAKNQFGLCTYGDKMITISRPLTEMNSEEMLRDVVLHEIAHAIAGHAAGHGPEWRKVAKSIGCSGKRQIEQVNAPEYRWHAKCPTPGCPHVAKRHRRPRSAMACTACCIAYAGGKYDARFRLEFFDTKA